METAVKSKDAPASQDAKHRPIETIRIEDCSASIWERVATIQGKLTSFYQVSFERAYKDGKDWKYVKSFEDDCLGKVTALCQQAGEFIRKRRETDAPLSGN